MSCASSVARSSSPSAEPRRTARSEPRQAFSVQNRLAYLGLTTEMTVMRKGVLLFAAATLARAPAIAQRAARYLNPQDVAEAQRMHSAMVQELGGAETGPRAAYVESIRRSVGAVSRGRTLVAC